MSTGSNASTGALDSDTESLQKAATLYAATGDLPAAEGIFIKLLAAAPSGRNHLALAMIQLQLRNPSDAAINIQIALDVYRNELQPQDITMAEGILQQLQSRR